MQKLQTPQPPRPPQTNYIIIDTDSYSGNFEREMCNFCTGKQEDNFLNHIGENSHLIKTVGVYTRECTDPEYEDETSVFITTNPLYYNDGEGIFIKRTDKRAASATKLCDAYMSVKIMLVDDIPKEALTIIKSRAQEFCKENNINLEGFRQPRL